MASSHTSKQAEEYQMYKIQQPTDIATQDLLITEIKTWANKNWNAIKKGTGDMNALVLEVLESLDADCEAGNTASFELNGHETNSGQPEIFYA